MTKIQTILCPHDFSDASMTALRFAQDVARDMHAAMFLVHVINPGSYLVDASTMTHPGMFDDYERKATDKLQRVAHELAESGISVEARVVYGRPHEVILAEATRVRADLIVMAAHGHNPLERFLLGSVADRVVRTASLPVMIVRGP